MVIAGCAKTPETTPNDAAKKYFDSWIMLNHPDAVPTELGSYILSEEPGTGAAAGKADDNLYVRLNYTNKKLDGAIQNTTYAKTAQQLGTYVETDYYGPLILLRAEGNVAVGFEELLERMKVGGKIEAAVPGWLSGLKTYSNKEDYLNNVTGTDYIYSIELTDVINDIVKWEVDSLVRYMQANYPEVNPADTVSTEEYNGKKYGFYYIQQKPTDLPDSTYKSSTKVYLNYTGRLLNGQVFDTTIEKVAKDSGIYSKSKTYQPTYVTWDEDDYDTITMGSSESDVIDGFKFALFQMQPHEKGIAIFYSAYGYQEDGSGNTIPGYSPLIFELELVDSE